MKLIVNVEVLHNGLCVDMKVSSENILRAMKVSYISFVFILTSMRLYYSWHYTYYILSDYNKISV